MSRNSILKSKSFDFAVRIINLYKYLKRKHGEQVMKAGTAIGALIREAEFAESRNDFKHKLSIGLKEANECVYWLELLATTNYISKTMFESLYSDAKELLRMLVSSLKTLKNNDYK